MFSDKENRFKRFEKKVWLSSPTMHGKELEYITEAYNTNWMSTVGKNIDEIEKYFKEFVGVGCAVALGTGTSAIHLAIKLAGVKEGDRVFCSDLTFSATVNPVIYEGGVPVFIDSEYETWNIDPLALEKAFEIFPDTKYVLVAHLYGTPSKIDEIKRICDKYGATLIEDAAESLGATYKGKQTGCFGKYNAISFNGNKIITGSSGGMLLTDEEEAGRKAKKWSTQSRDDALWYQHTELGYNYRMSNVVAGVIRGQAPYLYEHIASKKKIYQTYEKGFKNIPVKMNPADFKNSEPNYWLSCILIDKEAMSHQVLGDYKSKYTLENKKTCPMEILDTLKEYNVEGRPIWKPMHMQPIYISNYLVTKDGLHDNSGEDKSVGIDLFYRGLCLPSDNKMSSDEQNKIIEIIRSCFEEV